MASKHSITTEHGIGSISVGCLVDVASRTWPGINRPGGVARVTRVYEDAAVVDVSYMVGRSREKRVPLDYVTLAPQYETAETQGLRDRTLLLGRCRRCGSLRTDCGSCDWATEEKEQQNRQEQGNKEAVAEAAKMAREKFNKSADVEDSSEDSSEDDTALQDLLRTSQKGYKQHLRNREKWNALRESWIGNSDGGSLEEQPIHNQQQSASDDEDDEDVEELWQQSQRRYRRHIRQRVKWQRRISTTHEATNSAITSIRRDNHRSILETLGSATLHSESQKNGRRNVSKEKGESTLPISKAAQRNIDQSLIGVAKSSSPQLYQTDSVFPLNDDSESDHSSLDHHHRIASSLNDEKTTHDDPDAAFIQPEGRKAAENLPEDMVDQTKTIPYTQLPDFFNRTVADLEDRVLPDIGLRLAELRRQERRISSPRRLESIPISVVALLQQCYELWNEVTHQLIRNGTDQCRAALRRLSDDRLFRKNRKNLTLQQRKQLWSTASMDARHLRLDALEDSVETLVRQLKTVALALENHPSQELESEEGEGSAIFANCSEESEEEVEYDKDDYETQDLVPMHQMDQSSVVLDPCERPMGEFDPHQHAHKKRMNKRSHKNIINPVNTYRSGRPAEKTKKRAKTSPTRNPVIDCIENDDVNRNASACKSRSRLPSGDQASQEQPPGYFNSYRSDQGTWQIGQKDDDTNIQRSDLLPDIAIAENEESGNEPKSNLFDIETKRAASLRPTASQPRNHRPERDNVGGKCKPQSLPKAFLHSGYEKSMQRHRVPISQRMQAFLDKNNELNWQDDAIVEGETLDSKVDISQRRAQLRNRSSRKSEGNSIRSDRNTRQHSWSKTRPSSTARSSGKKEAITRNGLLGDRSLMEDLLVNFDDATNAPTTNLICSVPRVSASTLSSEIGQSYPNDPIRASRLLHQAHSTLNDNEDGMIELHRTTSTLLKRHGVQTLMELIACQSPQLECHVHLLTTLVRFGGEIQGSKEHFLELILLQMVDAVCAMVHLDGWALRIPNRVGILQLLIPIRDALAEKLPIAEALSCCIVEKLGCQEWRVGVNEDCIFVSSVDPSVWKRFVELGEYSIQRGESRYQKLGTVWPRFEVNAVWGALLYFGASKSPVDQTNQARWQLITKLFSCSVLAKSPHEDSRLPPNPKQLAVFESDIDIFARLLRRGTLDELPATDTLVINLVKRAIALQAEDYLLNEESRFCSFPSFGDEKSAAKLVSGLWKSTHGLLMQDASTIENERETVDEVNFRRSRGKKLGLRVNDLLLPLSPLLGGCLSLLLAWARRVPKKKVRRMRLLKQLKALRESLICLEVDLMQRCSKDSGSDAFVDAFVGNRSPETGDANGRMSAFLGEAAGYLKILEYLIGERDLSITAVTPCTNNILIMAKELWQSMAGGSLLKHRDSIANTTVDDDVKSLDPMKVFVAGKVMAAVAFMSLNLSPWCLTAISPRRQLWLRAEEYKRMMGDYSFAVSCIFACVDCLSRQPRTTPLLCHLLTIITILFNHFSVTAKIEGASPPFNRIAAEVSTTFTPILIRCLRRQVDSNTDSTDQIMLRLIFSALRGMSTFRGVWLKNQELSRSSVAAVITNISSRGSPASSTGGDFFDDLDDSIFASLEMEGALPGGQPAGDAKSEAKPYWAIMLEILVALKPSNRFKILNTLDGNEVLNLGPQAKYILSKDVDKICDCLVAMAVSGMRDHDSRTLWDDLMQLIRRSQSEDEDTEYEMKISRRIATELCFLSSEYSNCCSFVADNIELFFFEAIQFLLDPNRLEIYPSCHFELISEMGGEKAAKEALLALDLFDGEESSRPWNITIEDFESILELHIKRRTRAEFPWKIIESLTSVASKRSHSFTVILEDFVRALPTSFEESLSVASLEKESFVCFTCLRKVVSALAKSNIQLFEKMSAGILCFMASQLLRIVQGLRYLDQTILEGSLERSSPDGRTRVFCLFGAYSELFIALSAWILRETPAGMSGGWITLQSQLCEKIFYPLLRRQQSDMTSNLKVVMQSCRSISGSITPSTLPFSVIAGCTQYFEPFFDIALRRCHQLVSAPIQSSVLQNYLIEGLCLSEQDREVSIAKLIGNAFKAAPRDPCLLSQGPLQDEIDKYLSFVELNMPSSECESNMAQKRFEAMRSVIIPRISQRNGNLDVKRKILRVAIHILSSSDALKNVNSICKVSDLIASFVKSLRHTTFQSMISKFVDSNLISVLFSCAAKLAQLKISEDPCSDEISLLGQSDNAVAQLESCDLSILCESELKSLYFHTFFQWMFKLASKIARETEVANVHGQVYRFRALCSKVNQEVPDDSLLSDMILSPNDDEKSASLENWTKAVVWIEDKVFRSKSENVRPVVNVYSKPSVNSTDGDKTEYTLEPWRPSSGVTRSAKEYMADILYMSV